MTVLTCEHTMCDNEECFYAHSPEKPKNPLKELSDEQLVEKAIDESVEVARYNRAEHERTSHPDYDPYNDPDGPSEDMLVSECNDRLQLRELRRMPIARVFGCRSCYEEVPASEKLPAIAIVTMEHWTGWGGWGCDEWSCRKVHVYCSKCEKPAKGIHRTDSWGNTIYSCMPR